MTLQGFTPFSYMRSLRDSGANGSMVCSTREVEGITHPAAPGNHFSNVTV